MLILIGEKFRNSDSDLLRIINRIESEPSYQAMIATVRIYHTWCMSHTINSFPVSYYSLAEFVCARTRSLNGSSKSNSNVLSYLKKFCIVNSLGWLNKTDQIKLKYIKNRLILEDQQPIAHKDALCLGLLEILIKYKLDLSNRHDFLVAVMVLLGHNGLLRGGELLSGIKVKDIKWELDGTSIVLHLGATKSNRKGSGSDVRISSYRGSPCAFQFLKKWFNINHLWDQPDMYIFPYHFKGNKGQAAYFDFRMRASVKWWDGRIKSIASLLNLDPKRISKHSLRAGGATDLFVSGVAYSTIKKYGRWKSDAALLYYREETFLSITVADAFGRRRNGCVKSEWGATTS